MNKLVAELQPYARHHQDRRNNVAHFVGIGLTLLALSMLLAQPSVIVESAVWLNPAVLLSLLCAALYYSRFGWVAAVGMALLFLAFNAMGLLVLNTAHPALEWKLGLFAMGWSIPLLGHLLAGSKPAFMDGWRGVSRGAAVLGHPASVCFGTAEQIESSSAQDANAASLQP